MNNFQYYRPRVPVVVKNLIIINALMFLMTLVNEQFMLKTFSLFYFNSPFFKPYQFITYMFMHGGFAHIFFNMFSLYMFGSVLENLWGPKKFFLYYMVTGLGAGLFHELVSYCQVVMTANPHTAYVVAMTPTVGASGAIYGLLLAYGMLFPNNVISFVFPPISLKAKWMVLIFGLLELTLGLTGAQGNVAHFAHLGGRLFGLVLILLWKKKNKLYY